MMKTYSLLTVLILWVILEQTVSGLQAERELYTTFKPNSNSDGGGSLVSVDRQNNKRRTDVHIP